MGSHKAMGWGLEGGGGGLEGRWWGCGDKEKQDELSVAEVRRGGPKMKAAKRKKWNRSELLVTQTTRTTEHCDEKGTSVILCHKVYSTFPED